MRELPHAYGPSIHLLDSPYLQLGLARVCSPACRLPELNGWMDRLYRELLSSAVNHCVPQTRISVPTRMTASSPDQMLTVQVPDPGLRAVVVDIARAGTLPSQVCFDDLNRFFQPEKLRQDHILMNRSTDEEGRVTGSTCFGHKIGGTIEDAYVFLPDPMGATGSTLRSALELYRDLGKARKWIALHLIITPEYVRTIQSLGDSFEVFALRLDRGLSSDRALGSPPGTYPDEERGLNDKQYIVPGGGGIGEILNNAFI